MPVRGLPPEIARALSGENVSIETTGYEPGMSALEVIAAAVDSEFGEDD